MEEITKYGKCLPHLAVRAIGCPVGLEIATLLQCHCGLELWQDFNDRILGWVWSILSLEPVIVATLPLVPQRDDNLLVVPKVR